MSELTHDDDGQSEAGGEGLALDGEERPVSERWISAERVSGWIGSLVIGVGGLGVLLGVLIFTEDLSAWIAVPVIALWIVLAGLLVVRAHVYPALAHEHLRYALNARGIEIRRGVWWRELVSVPRSRVQHTDVREGPLMRRYGIATLVIHTAGTQHATVELPGLERAIAGQARDHLIGRDVGRTAVEDEPDV